MRDGEGEKGEGMGGSVSTGSDVGGGVETAQRHPGDCSHSRVTPRLRSGHPMSQSDLPSTKGTGSVMETEAADCRPSEATPPARGHEALTEGQGCLPFRDCRSWSLC